MLEKDMDYGVKLIHKQRKQPAIVLSLFSI